MLPNKISEYSFVHSVVQLLFIVILQLCSAFASCRYPNFEFILLYILVFIVSDAVSSRIELLFMYLRLFVVISWLQVNCGKKL